jgi:hypothetical protein
MAKIIKTAATATANYGTNGGAAIAANNWATNYSADIPAILAAAVAAVPLWQTNVALPQSAINMTNGLNRAKLNAGAIATKVNSVGKASFSAGVKAASLPGGDYSTFSAAWQPAVAQEVAQLNISNPRGTRLDNRARQAAYDAWVDTQAGKFRVK